jgi:DNA-directed RNA polymerase specialized sigma24 family protein
MRPPRNQKDQDMGLDSLPGEDKKIAIKVFHESKIEVETASGSNLVRRAQHGEEAAFTALFDAYKQRIYGLCLRMTGTPREAEDLTSEVFLRVFRKISTFHGASTFSTRLQQQTMNAVLVHLRKKRLQEFPLEPVAQTRS